MFFRSDVLLIVMECCRVIGFLDVDICSGFSSVSGDFFRLVLDDVG